MIHKFIDNVKQEGLAFGWLLIFIISWSSETICFWVTVILLIAFAINFFLESNSQSVEKIKFLIIIASFIALMSHHIQDLYQDTSNGIYKETTLYFLKETTAHSECITNLNPNKKIIYKAGKKSCPVHFNTDIKRLIFISGEAIHFTPEMTIFSGLKKALTPNEKNQIQYIFQNRCAFAYAVIDASCKSTSASTSVRTRIYEKAAMESGFDEEILYEALKFSPQK